jgi:hypothetical protein
MMARIPYEDPNVSQGFPAPIVPHQELWDAITALERRLNALTKKHAGTRDDATFVVDYLWELDVDEDSHLVGRRFADYAPELDVKKGT